MDLVSDLETIGPTRFRQRFRDEITRYTSLMTLKNSVSGELRRTLRKRGWTLDALAERIRELYPGTSWTKQGVAKVVSGETGKYLGNLEQIAAAMDARVSFVLLDVADDSDIRPHLAHRIMLMEPSVAAELADVVKAWALLTDDDRDLFLYRARKCLKGKRDEKDELPRRTG